MAFTNLLLHDYAAFLDRLMPHLFEAGITGQELKELDHLAYRVETTERYKELKHLLTINEEFVNESIINGRPISVFRFHQPLTYKGYQIAALELPAPSETPYKEGLEHAEFVVDNLEAFIERHSDLPFSTKEMNRKVNPVIGLKFSDCSAKFHAQSLLEAIRIEKETGLF